MPTALIPATGAISTTMIKASFPGKSGSLSAYRGFHSKLPTTGEVAFSAFRGITAVSPTHSMGASTGTNLTAVAAVNAATFSGSVSGTMIGTMTYTMSSYISSAYQNGTLTYALTAGTLPTGVTVDAAGIVRINTSAATGGAVSVSVTCTNVWGNTTDLLLTFNFAALAKVTPPTGWAGFFEAGKGQAYSSGASINSWTPSGTSGGVFTQGTVSAQPTYSIAGGGMNGNLPYVRFDGSSFMQNSSGTFNLPVLSGGGQSPGFTFVASVMFPNATDSFPRIFTGRSPTASYLEILRNGTNLQATMGQVAGNLIATNFAPANTWILIGFRYNGTTKLFELFKDSRATSVSKTVNALSYDFAFGNNTYIGKSLNADPLMKMDLNFMIMYPRSLSDAEMDVLLSTAAKSEGTV